MVSFRTINKKFRLARKGIGNYIKFQLVVHRLISIFATTAGGKRTGRYIGKQCYIDYEAYVDREFILGDFSRLTSGY